MNTNVPQRASAPTLATLPLTFAARHRAAIRVIDGGGGWARRAARELARQDGSIVIIDSPSSSLTEELNGLEHRVVLECGWLHSPVFQMHTESLRAGPTSLTEVIVEGSLAKPISVLAHEALIFVDKLVNIAELTILTTSSDRVSAVGTTALGSTLNVTVMRSAGYIDELAVRSISAEQISTLTVPDWRIAQPARLTIQTENGSRQWASSWETPTRLAFRHAAALLDDARHTAASDLHLYRRQLRYLASITA